jgi:hypothetical protein
LCDKLPFEENLTLYVKRTLIPFNQGQFMPSLVEIGLLVLEKMFFFIFQCILTLLLLSPLKKGYPLRWNKLKSPSPKNDLRQVWLKLAQWFWKRRFLINPTPILHFCDYLPFEEYLALYVTKLEFLSPKESMY